MLRIWREILSSLIHDLVMNRWHTSHFFCIQRNFYIYFLFLHQFEDIVTKIIVSLLNNRQMRKALINNKKRVEKKLRQHELYSRKKTSCIILQWCSCKSLSLQKSESSNPIYFFLSYLNIWNAIYYSNCCFFLFKKWVIIIQALIFFVMGCA